LRFLPGQRVLGVAIEERPVSPGPIPKRAPYLLLACAALPFQPVEWALLVRLGFLIVKRRDVVFEYLGVVQANNDGIGVEFVRVAFDLAGFRIDFGWVNLGGVLRAHPGGGEMVFDTGTG